MRKKKKKGRRTYGRRKRRRVFIEAMRNKRGRDQRENEGRIGRTYREKGREKMKVEKDGRKGETQERDLQRTKGKENRGGRIQGDRGQEFIYIERETEII